MGEAAEQSAFMKGDKRDLPSAQKVQVKKPTNPYVREASVESLASGRSEKIPEGAQPVVVTPSVAPDSREIPMPSVGGKGTPEKAFVPSDPNTSAAFIPADDDRSVRLKVAPMSPKDLGNKPLVQSETPVAACRISFAAVVGAKPIAIKPQEKPSKAPPLHLVGGSQKPPSPPKAPPTAPEMPELPGKKAAMEMAIEMLGDLHQKSLEQIESAKKAILEKASSTSVAQGVSENHLEVENRVLIGIVARLREENDRLRKEAKA